MSVADPCHLDIVCQCKTCDPFELMRQIITADVKFSGDDLQGKLFHKVTVYVGGDAVHLVGDVVEVHMIGIDVFVPV